MRINSLADTSTVLLVGTYSSLNKGDRLMQQVVAQQLSRLSPEIDVVLAAPFPEIDRHNYSGVTITKSRRRNLPLSFIKLVVLILLPLKLRKKYACRDAELKSFMRAAVIVDTSGDMLTEDYGAIVAISHLIPLLFAILLDKKFIVMAQSVGPFSRLKSVFSKVLSKAVVVTLRDQISYDYLAGLGFKNLEAVSDLGFLLKAESHHYVVGGSDRQDKQVIGFCPSSLLLKKFGNQLEDNSLESLCGQLVAFAKENHCVYELIPHVMTPSGKLDDDILCAEMAELMGDCCQVMPASLSPAEIKFSVSQMDALIAFRMHGAIAGLDSEIPTIVISYSHKTIGLFEKFGLQDWVIKNDRNMLNALFSKLPVLLKQREEIKLSLKSALPDIRQSAYRNIELLHGEVSL